MPKIDDMDALAELRDVWHGFSAGRVGPDAVVAAARRACGSGVQRRAPSLAQLANLTPEHYGHVGEIFNRVRGELQTAAARGTAPQAVAHQVVTPQAAAQQVAGTQAAAQQVAYVHPQAAYAVAGGAAVSQPGYPQAPGAYPMQPAPGGHPAPGQYASPGPYAAPGLYAAPGSYAAPPAYGAPRGAMVPGARTAEHKALSRKGLTDKGISELKTAGWICAVVSWFILWPLGIVGVRNGMKLSQAGEGQGIWMAIVGGLAAVLGFIFYGSRLFSLS